MKAKLLCVLLFATYLLGCSEQSEQLYGTWNCDYTVSNDGVTAGAKKEITYYEDGTFETSGRFSLVADEGQINYEYIESGIWSLSDDRLTETRQKGRVTESSPPNNRLVEMIKANYLGATERIDSSLTFISENEVTQTEISANIVTHCKK